MKSFKFLALPYIISPIAAQLASLDKKTGRFIFFLRVSTRFKLPDQLRLAGVSIVPFFEAFGAPIPTPKISILSLVILLIEECILFMYDEKSL